MITTNNQPPSLQIRPMLITDIEPIRIFTDHAIGAGYYSSSELKQIFLRSQTHDGQMMTLVLHSNGNIHGVRITYPAGQWDHGKGKGLTPESWPHPKSKTAYFQSLFIDPQLTGKNWGKKLSIIAIQRLKELGTKGVVCHSWKESPYDSSGRYLRSLGFQIILSHPMYWKKVDYTCTRCCRPCLCTAEEMYLDLTMDFSDNFSKDLFTEFKKEHL